MFSILLILGGAVTMGVSLWKTRKIVEALPLVADPPRARLQGLMGAHRALMAIFLLGYLATAASFALEWRLVGQVFVGLIYFLGSLFVYLGLAIQMRIVGEIVKTLEQFVPICASCKRIRQADRDPEDMDSWKPLEAHFAKAHNTTFSHGICPNCMAKLYPAPSEPA